MVGGADAATRAHYACALVKTAAPACGAPNLSATLIHGPDFKRRVTMLHHHKARRSPVGALAVSMFAVAGLALTATGGAAAQTAETDNVVVKLVERRTDKPLTDAERNAIVDQETADRCAKDARRTETTTETIKDGKPVTTRLILCSTGAKAINPAQLQSMRDSLSKLEKVKPETRAAIAVALDAAIAQARDGQ